MNNQQLIAILATLPMDAKVELGVGAETLDDVFFTHEGKRIALNTADDNPAILSSQWKIIKGSFNYWNRPSGDRS